MHVDACCQQTEDKVAHLDELCGPDEALGACTDAFCSPDESHMEPTCTLPLPTPDTPLTPPPPLPDLSPVCLEENNRSPRVLSEQASLGDAETPALLTESLPLPEGTSTDPHRGGDPEQGTPNHHMGPHMGDPGTSNDTSAMTEDLQEPCPPCEPPLVTPPWADFIPDDPVDTTAPTTLSVQDTLDAVDAQEDTVAQEETLDLVDPQEDTMPKGETLGVHISPEGATAVGPEGIDQPSRQLVPLTPTGVDQWVGTSGVPGGMASRGVEAGTDMSRVTYRVTVHTSSISGRSLGGFPYIEIEGTLRSTGLQVNHIGEYSLDMLLYGGQWFD
jgi:hypothetical protein